MFLCSFGILMGSVSTMSESQGALQDTTAVESIVAGLTESWNKGDAKAFASRFAKDGGFTNVLGKTYYGREGFEARHAEIFATIYKGSTAKLTITKLRFIRPDVVLADIHAELRGFVRLPGAFQPEPDGSVHSALLLVLVKENGEWWITEYHNVGITNLPPPKN